MRVLSTLRRRAADERGFTLIVVMFALMISLLATGGAYMAVSGDTRSSAYSEAQSPPTPRPRAG